MGNSCKTCAHSFEEAHTEPCSTCLTSTERPHYERRNCGNCGRNATDLGDAPCSICTLNFDQWAPVLSPKPTRYRLAAKMANAMQEIIDDEHAADQTLRTALAFHANTRNEIQKRSREVWDSIGKEFGIPVRSQNFEVVNEDGVAYVVAAPLEQEKPCKD